MNDKDRTQQVRERREADAWRLFEMVKLHVLTSSRYEGCRSINLVHGLLGASPERLLRLIEEDARAGMQTGSVAKGCAGNTLVRFVKYFQRMAEEDIEHLIIVRIQAAQEANSFLKDTGRSLM